MNRPAPGAPTAAAQAAFLVERAAVGDRHALARLVSLLEDTRPGKRALQIAADEALRTSGRASARIFGITGTPGSGKSTLVARITDRLLAQDPGTRIAVVAVDPSSPTSGGALLGDRTRIRPTGNDRLFVRSQSSASSLGGLAPSTYLVCSALRRLFDLVFVETVGIGQSESDIRHLADDVMLVLSPLAGDELQFLKAGIIEIPDAFVVSKWDEPAARRTYHQLRSALGLARPFDADAVGVFTTSTKTGEGLDDLAADVVARARRSRSCGTERSASHFFRRWVGDEWGRVGLAHLDQLGGASALLAGEASLTHAQERFDRALREHLGRLGAGAAGASPTGPADRELRSAP